MHSEAARRVKAMDGFHERKVSKRKATLLVRASCALRKMAVVPTQHPCRDVTKTHFLCVFQPFSSSARRTRKGEGKAKAKAKAKAKELVSGAEIFSNDNIFNADWKRKFYAGL